jgi:hypothetical protein
MLIEKVTRDHGDEASRQTILDTYLEEAAHSLDGLMNTLHQHTSIFIDEDKVNDALKEQHEHSQGHCEWTQCRKFLHRNMQHGSMPMENTTGSIDEFVTPAGTIIGVLQQQW